MVVLDTSVVDLHRTKTSPCRVKTVRGIAFRVPDDGTPEPVTEGTLVHVGDTVALDAHAMVELDGFTWSGGRRGRAHAMVKDEAFRSSPDRSDVPRLVAQLAQMESDMSVMGGDPLLQRDGPTTPFERSYTAEFARLNLDPDLARSLAEDVARREQAVLLFTSEETAFVAVSELTVPKLRALMTAIGRPVNPHLVEPSVIEDLLQRVYV